MYSNLPKTIKLALFILRGLGIKDSLAIVNDIVYLWREFYIRTKITPIISKFKISFYLKDDRLCGAEVTKIKDLKKVIDSVKEIEFKKEL